MMALKRLSTKATSNTMKISEIIKEAKVKTKFSVEVIRFVRKL